MEMLIDSQQNRSVSKNAAKLEFALFHQKLVLVERTFQATTSIPRQVSANGLFTVAVVEMLTGSQQNRSVSENVAKLEFAPFHQKLVLVERTFQATTSIPRLVSANGLFTVAVVEMLTGSQQNRSVSENVAKLEFAPFHQKLVLVERTFQATTSIPRLVSVSGLFTVAVVEMLTGSQQNRSVSENVAKLEFAPFHQKLVLVERTFQATTSIPRLVSVSSLFTVAVVEMLIDSQQSRSVSKNVTEKLLPFKV